MSPVQPGALALRAVGRHREEVAALTPDDVLVQAVETRVGCRERTGLLEIARDARRRRCRRASSAADKPATRAYRKPWKVNSGSHSSSPPAAMKTSVCSLLMPTMLSNHDPSAASVSVCSIDDRAARAPCRAAAVARARRSPGRSRRSRPPACPSTDDRRQLEHPTDRLAGERAQHVVVAADLGHRHPFAVVEARRGPTRPAPRGGRTARRRRGRRTPTGPVALRTSAPEATTSVRAVDVLEVQLPDRARCACRTARSIR